MNQIREDLYRFDDLEELYQTADDLPDVDRHDVYAHHEELDEWTQVSYRDSLWTDDGRATGIVSSYEEFYNVIQYGDILWTIGQGIEQQKAVDLDVHGEVSVSPTAHKMSARINFEGEPAMVWADPNDRIDLGLKVRTGHSGYHALKYDVGAERQVCSNGMMAFVSDLHFEQTHSEPFQPGLAYQAVDAVLESPETIEYRIEDAQNQELINRDEALLVLLDFGLDRYLENPVPELINALHEEVEDPDAPTLWETYNAATRALTHYTRGVPEYDLDQGFEAAASLLETGYSEVPDPQKIGGQAVRRRADTIIEESDPEPYWEGEEESIRELLETHELEA